MSMMSLTDVDDSQTEEIETSNPLLGGGGAKGWKEIDLGGFFWSGLPDGDGEDDEIVCGPRGEDLITTVHTQSMLVDLLTQPVPEGQVMRCLVCRETGVLGKAVTGEDIALCLQDPGNDATGPSHRVLLAQKKSKSSTLNIHLNLPEIMGRQRVAKLRGEKKGKYTLYDAGATPGKSRGASTAERKELGTCVVTTETPASPITLDINLVTGKGNEEQHTHLETMKALYDKERKCHFLPFQGSGTRVKQSSRHNFLIKRDGDDLEDRKTLRRYKSPLQMGKVDSGFFSLDFRAPLSPVQAFFLALCHMDQ